MTVQPSLQRQVAVVYDFIAENYSSIFPLSPEKVSCVRSFLDEGDLLIDVGCATGDLCIALGEQGFTCFGIDLNEKMVGLANLRARTVPGALSFRTMKMLDITEHFEEGCFKVITCFGNTLPLLQTFEEVSDFFNKVYSLLSPAGVFILQFLNYDQLLRNHSHRLPDIRTGNIVVRQFYDYQETHTKYTIEMKRGRKTYSSSAMLFPLKRRTVLSALQDTGFNNLSCSADFTLKPCTGKEFSTVYTAYKLDIGE
jgi:2-polyprenyl-3-methyl-5-hydroxy-6-metoxy-1,4-benzoquinol methylase